jgi:3-polyprenyl-4-hydroxybenzoate decarboxylase
MEQALLTIPKDVAADIQNGSTAPLARRLLELAATRAYEADLITSRQVQEMLGFETREELFEFFKKNDVRSKVTREDLERERAAAAALFGE